MPNHQLLPCRNCGLPQPPTTRQCPQCGLNFAVTRTWQHLDRSEDAIAQGQPDLAADLLRQADVAMFPLSDDLRRRYLLTARAFYLQGQLYYNKGDVDAARSELLLAQSHLSTVSGSEELLARTLLLLGGIAYFHGHVLEATAYFGQCSDLAIPLAAYGLAARALTSEANIQATIGDTASATHLYARALAQAELSHDPSQQAYTYRLAAGFYLNAGQCRLAYAYANRLLALCPQIEDKNALTLAWADAGWAFLKYGDLLQADHCLRQAYDLATRTDYKIGLMSILVYLAELARLLHDDANWLAHASRVYHQVSGAAQFWRADAALELVRYYATHHDWPHALKCLNYLEAEMGDDWSADEKLIYQSHARAHYHAARQQWQAAETHFQTLIALLDRLDNRYEAAIAQYEYATLLLDRARRDDNYAPADALLRQCAATFRTLELPHHLASLEALLHQPRWPRRPTILRRPTEQS